MVVSDGAQNVNSKYGVTQVGHAAGIGTDQVSLDDVSSRWRVEDADAAEIT